MNNPNFEKKLNQKVVRPKMTQSVTSGYGIVLSYSSAANTANVQMVKQDTPEMGQVYKNVPCPTNMGVQSVAPEQGRPCWVDFKGSGTSSDYFPVITTFFNHAYNTIDEPRQSTSVNNTPRYILGT